MLEELYENGIIFYAVCGICALNIIMKLIEALYCTYIWRQSAYMYEATGKFAVRINRKFDNEYDENGDIRNVGLFVKAYISDMKIAGFRAGFWRNFGIVSVFLCIVLCIMCVIEAYFSGDNSAHILFYALLAPASVGAAVFVDMLAGIKNKIERVILNVTNYYENYVIPEKINGTYDIKNRKLYHISDEIDEGIAELAESMEEYEAEMLRKNINKNKENNPEINLSNGEQKIFEEVINEYLT